MAIKDIKISKKKKKNILSEINNHITNSDFTRCDVNAVRKSKYFTMLVQFLLL